MLVWDISNEYRAVVMKIKIILVASILLLSSQVNAALIELDPGTPLITTGFGDPPVPMNNNLGTRGHTLRLT